MLTVSPPAIPFKRPKKKEKSDEKDQYQTNDILLDPSDKTSDTTEWKVPVFEQGDAEDWVKWRIAYENLVEAYPLDTAEKQVKMLRTLLKGEAKDRFNTAYAASRASTDAAKLTSAINEVAKSHLMTTLTHGDVRGGTCATTSILHKDNFETSR